ncbi:nuclear transport factor 2 family protein [Nocardia arizonensis]|uniref:nuclear transport factor 2 family protein n=1 Tax=Nocardia arizonensis TaxID=1141647 RepID=UPI0006D08838|nr:nuclear transport factor 2 family protein [Nocardia arizonensis]
MSNREAVDLYYRAWTSSNGNLADVPLSEDFVFTGPVGTFHGRAEVQVMAQQFGPVAQNFRVLRQYAAGDTVISVVAWELPGTEGSTEAAEILTIDNGVITRADLFYDPRLVLEFTASATAN